MKHTEFISALDEKRIAGAIAAAEKKTTGQILAFVSKHETADPLAAAKKHFQRLGMHRTKGRNAVLLFVAPRSRTFAIYGDAGIHEKCGDGFWSALRDEMTTHLKEGRYTDALVHAIAKAGELLAIHFPAEGDHPNEQPDSVLKD
jgi:uncharacterized membrane protein